MNLPILGLPAIQYLPRPALEPVYKYLGLLLAWHMIPKTLLLY